jgi:hypothetical protein
MKPSTGSPSTRRTSPAATTPARSDRPDGPSDQVGATLGHWLWPAGARKPDWLPPALLAARPGLFVLMMFLLVALLAATAGWDTRPHSEPAGIDLLAGESSLSLDATSVGAPPDSPASAPKMEVDRLSPDETAKGPPPAEPPLLPPPEPGPVVLAAVPAVSLPPTPEPPTLLAGAVEKAPVAPAAALQLTDEPYALPYVHRGDSPMMRDWKLIGLPAFLAAVLTAGPAPAVEPDKEPDRTSALLRQLEDMRKDLKAAIEDVRDQCRKNESAALNSGLRNQTLQGDLNKLAERVTQMEKELAALRNQSPAQSRVSAFGPGGTGMGRVLLRNSYPEQMAVILNGQSHRLAPGESRVVEVPAGTFTYEVLGVQELRTRPVPANPAEAFLVHIYPR